MSSKAFSTADLEWRAGDAPFSKHFQDIYFSAEGGLAESAHVFLKGNDLPEAWAGSALFCICETGFGTGLNFLACWDLWRRTRKPGQRLHYVAVEKHPLLQEDMHRALKPWAELGVLSDQLLNAYPLPQSGFHRLHLSDQVTLTLAIGDVVDVLASLEAGIDAWFLDGFSPACNPDMWRDEMYRHMARLSQPQATLSTYTVAGRVRRGLMNVACEVAKSPGYGTKRDMLRGNFSRRDQRPSSSGLPWYRIPRPGGVSERHALIIGGGIAGCSMAAALMRRDWRVTLVERHPHLAGEASGNPIGIVMPRMIVGGGAEGQLYAETYRYALQELHHLGTQEPALAQGLKGVLELGVDEPARERHAKLLGGQALPDGLMEAVDAREATALAGIPISSPALHFPQGGWLDPSLLCRVLAREASVSLVRSVAKLAFEDGSWRVFDEGGALIGEAPVLILANGLGALRFPQAAPLPLKAYRGQITSLALSDKTKGLSKVLTFGSYLTPAVKGRHVIGATYDAVPVERDSASVPVEVKDHGRNLDALTRRLPDLFAALDTERMEGRAALRCASPDSHALAGPVPDWNFYREAYERVRHGLLGTFPPASYQTGLYVHVGLGSRGLTNAFLSAELLANQITGEPWGVAREVAEIMHPGRFLIRALKRASTCSV